jgi:hypothetical protein
MTMFRRLDLPGFFFAMDLSYIVQAAIYIDDVFIGIWQSVFHNATAVDYRTCCKVKRFCWIDIWHIIVYINIRFSECWLE